MSDLLGARDLGNVHLALLLAGIAHRPQLLAVGTDTLSLFISCHIDTQKAHFD